MAAGARHWSGWHVRRELIVGLLVGAITVGVQLGLNDAGAVDTVISTGVLALVTGLYPLFELAWRWVEAPMRLALDGLTEIRGELAVLRARVDELEPAQAPFPAAPTPVSYRLELLNFKPQGEELPSKGLGMVGK